MIFYLGNLLKDYCANNPIILTGRFVFSFTVILTMPLQIFSSREAITTILYKYTKFKWWKHALITLGICIICFIPAVLLKQIEDVMSFAGALVAAPVVLILPGLSLLYLMKQGLVVNNLTKIGCYVIVTFGLIILFAGTGVSIYTFFEPKVEKIQYWCPQNVISDNYNQLHKKYSNTILNQWKP